MLAAALAGEGAIEGALRRYDAERRLRTQATARGAPAPMGAAPLHRALETVIRLTPAPLWRKGIAADGNAPWRWQPPHLPVAPSR